MFIRSKRKWSAITMFRSDMKSPVSSVGSEDEGSSSKGKNSNPFETIDDE